ncbi:AraC family transcriptional regulator [Ferruginibacter lapsinanis]|uniref:AraC family transcriptional regulator n=1 Tax=Ferruginibacter lapsinanis TaxID=563172 RepID=UPI001E30C352|nr:AraC family transcriptional regulator [Ferruginibacter lapsinanis]UEG49383.1 AraC family transcriptional regulator [Ferruginibacter lapsinanis]
MKPFIEKPPITEDISFLAKTYRTPLFEIPWHKHIEYELILFTEGEGVIFIGDHVGDFKPGDIYFIGSNLPHTFQKTTKDTIVNAVVIQFRDDFWGKTFIDLPESKQVRHLLEQSLNGLKIGAELKGRITPLIKELEFIKGFLRIIKLCECLQLLTEIKQFDKLSTQGVKDFSFKKNERIDKVFQYTIENFQEPITLSSIAAYANMSTPAFCNYFKKCAKKPYISFLNEVRIGYACTQLIDTQKSVESICYESGYATLANFNKQFQKVKRSTPSAYRRTFRSVL